MTQPTQQDVAYRALCLGALVRRGEFEQVFQSTENRETARECKAMTAKLNQWLKDERLAERLSEIEREIFDIPLGDWDEQIIIDVSWRADALGCILWALSLIDKLPPYDSIFLEDEVKPLLGLFSPTRNFMTSVRLRAEDEIAVVRDIAEMWNWRARTRFLEEDTDESPDELANIIKSAALGMRNDGFISKPIDDDFPAFGKAYRNLTEEEFGRTSSIARERHFALNWLCGYSEDWDETPTDT